MRKTTLVGTDDVSVTVIKLGSSISLLALYFNFHDPRRGRDHGLGDRNP